jgi:hypothetical protein
MDVASLADLLHETAEAGLVPSPTTARQVF